MIGDGPAGPQRLLRHSWMVPGPWRSLTAVLIAASLGTGAGMIAGPSEDALFRIDARPAERSLAESPQRALPALDDVLPLSPQFESKEPGDTDLGSSPEAGEGGPAYLAWGRTEVHRAAFWRPAPSAEAGPLEVQAEVAAYRDQAGAREAFSYWQRRLSIDWTNWPVDLPADETAAFEVRASPFTFQWIQFRKANGTGILVITGPEDQTPRETGERLAALMAERMR